ncbi:hypothetical protein [Pseudomonas alloputida]|uniref:hypothetical protein n=1 Tax=Pseudomonas TaxID=286 RepID=UPI003EEE9114
MNTIKNLVAYNSDVPGEPTYFEVRGTVTVAHTGIEPVLVEPKFRNRGGWEVLELQLVEKEGIALQVVTQKDVLFRREGGTSWKYLEVIEPAGSQRVEIGHRQATECE